MTDDEQFAYHELSMLLTPNEEPKIFCPDSRQDSKGHTVANCTRGLGHFGQHVDCHAGRKWEDR